MYSNPRNNMILGQLRPHFSENSAILHYMALYPRELFVPNKYKPLAYSDIFIEIAKKRFLPSPLLQAQLLHSLPYNIQDRVLIIGGGAGYSAAILSHLVDLVVVCESHPRLADQCGINMAELMIDDVMVSYKNNMSHGCLDHAPYDIIYIEGGIEYLPPKLFNILNDKGIIIAIEATQHSHYITLWHKNDGNITKNSIKQVLTCPILTDFLKH